jgi:Co/Zn/Cd efflux system component
MSATCHDHDPGPAFAGGSPAYRRALLAVIAINGVMFVVELGAGVAAGSMALQADAMDFLADTMTYALSLWVIGRPAAWRTNAALFKGLSLGALGIWVLGATLWRVFVEGVPEAYVMGAVGLLALVANLVSVALLFRFRDGEANIRSVWLCSRNDAIGNVAVVAAASGVFATGAAWPDLAVAAVMASLFLTSAVKIIRQAMVEHARLATG